MMFGGTFNIFSQERSVLYFADYRDLDLLDAYRTVISLVKSQECQHVGLDTTFFNIEYPLLAWLGADRGTRSVTHVGVQNLSARYGKVDRGIKPCAVICLYCVTAIEKWERYAASVGPGTIVGNIVVFRARGKSSANNES
jgi:hypothetical protein